MAYSFSNKPIQRMCHHGFKTTSKPAAGEILVINRLRALDNGSHTIAVFLFIHANAYPRKWDRKSNHVDLNQNSPMKLSETVPGQIFLRGEIRTSSD